MCRFAIVLGVLGLAACASGFDTPAIDARIRDAAELDAPGQPDAAVADAADIDAAAGGPDARTDAAVIDARLIDARLIDARPVDALTIDAPTDAPLVDGPPPVIASLLLAEIVLTPTGGELIELVNPTGAAIDLSSYYLSDAPEYFRLPAGVTAIGADATDFVARFPAGASVPAHGVVTVAISTAAAFTTAYPTIAPTFSLGAGANQLTVLTTGTATLTNGGEPAVLFFWDGASDLVTDVDIMNAGSPSTATNALVNKSGVMIDGPDPGTTATAYRTDAMTLPTQSVPGNALSTKRIALESAAVETQTNGNGVDGNDETSEQTGTTWDGTAYTAATPGTVPSALLP